MGEDFYTIDHFPEGLVYFFKYVIVILVVTRKSVILKSHLPYLLLGGARLRLGRALGLLGLGSLGLGGARLLRLGSLGLGGARLLEGSLLLGHNLLGRAGGLGGGLGGGACLFGGSDCPGARLASSLGLKDGLLGLLGPALSLGGLLGGSLGGGACLFQRTSLAGGALLADLSALASGAAVGAGFAGLGTGRLLERSGAYLLGGGNILSGLFGLAECDGVFGHLTLAVQVDGVDLLSLLLHGNSDLSGSLSSGTLHGDGLTLLFNGFTGGHLRALKYDVTLSGHLARFCHCVVGFLLYILP